MHADVFAVEDTSVQVCWRGAGGGPLTIWAGPRSTMVPDAGSVGAAVVEGLAPGTEIDVMVTPAGGGPVRAGSVRTLVPPPGRRLSRFATLNDMHIGARFFGLSHPMWNDDPADPHATRCMRDAIAEAVAWGAEAIVVKGDLTQQGRPNEWEIAGEMLAGAGLPLLVIEGNHETKRGSVDGRAILGGHGIDLTVGRPSTLDLPGVRIIGVPTARWHHGDGMVEAHVLREAAALAASAPPDGGVVVVLHHYPQRFRYPTLYPEGIPGDNARLLLDALADANPATLVLAGHSHRHRRHDYHRIGIAESGSTKDFPGSWAGYTVHEGGVMQTTRRVMGASSIAWTERGRDVLGGIWGIWAPGLRSHRCFTYPWPHRQEIPGRAPKT